MKEFNWDNAPVICELNGTKWLLGPEAEDPMNWENAKEWCKSQGGVLPPRDILLHAYLNQDIVGGFADAFYWSASEYGSGHAWNQDFDGGYQFDSIKGNTTVRVRAVRRMKMKEFNWDTAPTICEIDGTQWLLGPEAKTPMSWEDAKNWCQSMGGVLPPRDVLLQTYINQEWENWFKESLGGFATAYYWSSSEDGSSHAWFQEFSNGVQGTNSKSTTNFRVRAVRSLK
jgi:hypothetical protein